MYLCDINYELINTYKVVRDNVDELIAKQKKHLYEKEYFYNLRNADRNEDYVGWSDIDRASRFIYLNKTCYNGLYRVNSSGQFNVPFGKYANPKILDEGNLRACHEALQGAELTVGSFLQIEEIITDADFVYFDPPYAPLDRTSNFTSYSQTGFNFNMQQELKKLCDRLDRSGVRFMLSNSSAPSILTLYENYNIEFVYAARAINSNRQKRGKIPEIIVTNY